MGMEGNCLGNHWQPFMEMEGDCLGDHWQPFMEMVATQPYPFIETVAADIKLMGRTYCKNQIAIFYRLWKRWNLRLSYPGSN